MITFICPFNLLFRLPHDNKCENYNYNRTKYLDSCITFRLRRRCDRQSLQKIFFAFTRVWKFKSFSFTFSIIQSILPSIVYYIQQHISAKNNLNFSCCDDISIIITICNVILNLDLWIFIFVVVVVVCFFYIQISILPNMTGNVFRFS